jgi:hypothetical protein
VRGRTITEETYQINFTVRKQVPGEEPKRPAETKPTIEPAKPQPKKPLEKAQPRKAGKKAGRKK